MVLVTELDGTVREFGKLVDLSVEELLAFSVTVVES